MEFIFKLHIVSQNYTYLNSRMIIENKGTSSLLHMQTFPLKELVSKDPQQQVLSMREQRLHSCVATILMESSPCLKILQLTKNICILHKIDYSSPFFLVYY